MAEPHVVSALKAKRAELAGEIELTTRKLQGLRAALEHLDPTLCLFDPAAVPDAIEPKVWCPKADWAKRGEMDAHLPGHATAGVSAALQPGHRARAHDRARHGHGRRTPRKADRQAHRMLPARAAGDRASHVRGWAGADGGVADRGMRMIYAVFTTRGVGNPI